MIWLHKGVEFLQYASLDSFSAFPHTSLQPARLACADCIKDTHVLWLSAGGEREGERNMRSGHLFPWFLPVRLPQAAVSLSRRSLLLSRWPPPYPSLSFSVMASSLSPFCFGGGDSSATTIYPFGMNSSVAKTSSNFPNLSISSVSVLGGP